MESVYSGRLHRYWKIVPATLKNLVGLGDGSCVICDEKRELRQEIVCNLPSPGIPS
jgi:hypothetical protein